VEVAGVDPPIRCAELLTLTTRALASPGCGLRHQREVPEMVCTELHLEAVFGFRKGER